MLKKKNVLILSSSPRRNGNSDMLCDEFLRGVVESGSKAEKIFLGDETIHCCTGCSLCSQYKKACPQKDNAAEDEPMIMDRIVSNFRGFLDCLKNPVIKGTVFCGGVWQVGEIKGKPALRDAYKIGKRV